MKRWYLLIMMVTVIASMVYGVIPAKGGADGPTGTARIVVKVVLIGAPPAMPKLQMSADAVCAKKNQGKVVLSHEELSLLLGGMDLGQVRRKRWYRK